MKFIADLHIHSRYSRATSSDLTPENLWLWGQRKGLNVIGAGDCIHPQWLDELEEKLEPAESGFYCLQEKFTKAPAKELASSCRGDVRFILSTEISCIYKKGDKVRKVHNVVIFSSFEAARKFQKKIGAIGNIKSDGRPILGLDAKDLLAIALECDPRTLFIPAHIWTPWFSVLGSKSGFDSIEECYGDLTQHIYALETGLSSDPLMNWRLKSLDQFVLVSNSDAHSASKLAREANIFDCEFSYDGIFHSLSVQEDKGFQATIEFFPEEGKYHYDGHAACKLRLHPKDTPQDLRCPECGGLITVGVMSRVEELAVRPEGQKAPRARPYFSLIPLEEVIAETRGVGKASKKVQEAYFDLLNKLGPELCVLLDVPLGEIRSAGGDLIAEGICRMREGKVAIAPGYDGEFGVIKIFGEEERPGIKGQICLFRK